MSKVVLVTGSRDWRDSALIARVLEMLAPDLLVEGGARGADRIASVWAQGKGVKTVRVVAHWDEYGKKAGAIRNSAMLDLYPKADVVAFPLPSSIGTYDCIRKAVKRGHKVMVVKPSGDWSIITSEDPRD
mgnify:CR=1 FL=1